MFPGVLEQDIRLALHSDCNNFLKQVTIFKRYIREDTLGASKGKTQGK